MTNLVVLNTKLQTLQKNNVKDERILKFHRINGKLWAVSFLKITVTFICGITWKCGVKEN